MFRNPIRRGWISALVGLLLVAGCAQKPATPPSDAPAPPPAAAKPAAAMSAFENAIVAAINTIRQKNGLPPLKGNSLLAGIARGHSRAMTEQNFFSHNDPRGAGMEQRLKSASVAFRLAAENLARNTNVADPIKTAVDGWMNSPGHRHNILTVEFNETGVGIWQQGKSYYFTQLFIRSK
jgi:uncharacterized protein YkwD